MSSAAPLDLLLVEDNDGDAALITETLEHHWPGPSTIVVHRATTLAEAVAVVGATAVDCALLDLGLPDSRGIESVHRLRAERPSLPIVVLSGQRDAGTIRAAIGAGAMDYLTKDAHPDPESVVRSISLALARPAPTEPNDASNHLLRSVAHDLKTPLSAIRGFATLLQTRSDRMSPATQEDMLGRIVDNVDRLRSLIDGTLSFSSAGVIGAPDDVPLDRVLDWVRGLVQTQLESVDAELTCRDLPTVHGDETSLRSVFLNLVSNSIKYAGDERRLRIDVVHDHDRCPDGHHLVLVDDTGVGIPEDVREAVFELGRRLHDDVEGSGVGLATTRRAVTAMGGSVRAVPPADGWSTTIEVVLPESSR